MISTLIYDSVEKELNLLQKEVKNQAAYLSDENWNYIVTHSFSEIKGELEKISILDLACMEIKEEENIPFLEEIRERFEEMFLLLIADMSISPMSYMKPSVMASSLLLRPCTEDDIKKVIREFLEAYMKRFEKKDGHNSYVIDSKEGRVHIPFEKILYFESRNKKVYVQTESAEYGFYNTIDNLEAELPGYFIRCHRSFIVNSRKIEKVMISQNVIYLVGEIDVPLSRSYKAVLKELGKKI